MIRLQELKLVFGRTEPEPRTDQRTDGWTDRHGSQNSNLDLDVALF